MNSKKITICFSCFVFFVLQLASFQIIDASTSSGITGSSQEKVFQAGASTTNITPSLSGGKDGSWSHPQRTHIHDELRASCLVLDDGETRLAFVVLDLIGIGRELVDAAKSMIEKETNLPGDNVIISATHTHSCTHPHFVGGPPFTDYQEFIISRIADAVKIAINNLEPARVGWGVGSVPEHVFVRRWIMKTPQPNPFGGYDRVKMNPGSGNPNLLEPEVEPDPEVSFISVQAKDGRPIALFANYSLHYVGIGTREGHVSAGYFSIFADRIKELLGADRQDPPFVGIMSNGTSGEVNNLVVDGPTKSYKPYERAHEVADGVAREVLRVYNNIEHHDWVSLQAAREELTIQVRKPDRQMIERAERVLSRPDTKTPVNPREKDYAQRILRLMEWPDQIDIVLQAFRVGELGIATSPFETSVEIGLEIKEKSPFKPSFTISFANGYSRYLPTPEQHELGGYETWIGANIVEVEASKKMVDKLLELFTKIE